MRPEPRGARRSARAVVGAGAGGDEDGGGGGAGGHVRRVPHTGRVDRIVAGGEGFAGGAAIGKFLHQRHFPRGADDQLRAVGVDFPGGPAFGEAVLRDKAPLDPVGGVALFVARVPSHAVEGWFDGGGGV